MAKYINHVGDGWVEGEWLSSKSKDRHLPTQVSTLSRYTSPAKTLCVGMKLSLLKSDGAEAMIIKVEKSP